MRKPNYDFERSQREKAKEIKAQQKALKKQEKAAETGDGSGSDQEGSAGAGGDNRQA